MQHIDKVISWLHFIYLFVFIYLNIYNFTFIFSLSHNSTTSFKILITFGYIKVLQINIPDYCLNF